MTTSIICLSCPDILFTEGYIDEEKMMNVNKMMTTGILLLVASAGVAACADSDVPAPDTVTVTEMPNYREDGRDNDDWGEVNQRTPQNHDDHDEDDRDDQDEDDD